MMRARRFVLGALVVAGLLAGVGCGPPPQPKSVPDIVWPAPPEVPRFKLERVLTGESDYQPPPGWFRRVFLGAKKPGEMTELKQPFGVACHPTKRLVYVAERKLRKILVFDEEAKKLRVIGDAVGGRLALVLGIAVDEKGTVYAVDNKARRVYAYRDDGSLLRVYGQKDEFKRPVGVAVDTGRGRLYVTDVAVHKILVLELETGKVLETWGGPGRGLMQFAFPGFLALDRKGNLLVSDQLNFRIQVISPAGKLVRAIGSSGDRPGTFFRIKGIGVDSENHYYAVDEAFANVQVFQDDGKLLMFFGQGGQRPGELNMPVGLCVGPDDTVWITESLIGRIQGVRYLRNAHIPSAAPSKGQPASSPSAPASAPAK